MLVYADADAVRPAHIVDFYARLGGGLRDATWDGSARSVARLAILPGHTHYDIFGSPDLGSRSSRSLTRHRSSRPRPSAGEPYRPAAGHRQPGGSYGGSAHSGGGP